MPTIGITACRKIEDYRQSILHAGGEVRVLEPTTSVEEALAGIDGLLLTGGEDVDPARYGEPTHASVTDVDPARDEFEIGLIAAARGRDLPIFAICRGVQVLNIACGGTLVQDIPSEVSGALEHTLAVPPHQSYDLAHEIWMDKDSRLAKLMSERLGASDTCDVNSRHHQAVKTVAPGFRVSATAPDGVIEAIEDPAAGFCLGVQWHPENFWRTGEFRPLYEGFLDAAERAARRTGRS
jgi:putative glutamine amidotransferase